MGFRIENNVLKKYEEEPDVTEVVIPEGVREIGVSAFDRIESVRKIILPQSIEVIQKWAFFGCKNLEEINLPKGLLSIGVSAFCCTAIRKIVIPDGAEIGEEAFGRCDLLQDVTIENGIKLLKESSFCLCPSLKKVKLPETLETIGHSCFADCKNLTDISLPFGLKEIGEKAFSGCGLKKITIPSGTSAIGKQAFARCKMKTAGPIGGGYDYEFGWTTAIPKYAFSGLKKLESVQLSDSISEIGISAFADCKALVKINVRNDMKIEKNAFKGCVSLGSGDHSGTAESASPFTIVNGVLSAYSGQEKTDIVIPDGVITIANRAFYNKLISSVVIPASVASIEKEAFEYSGLSHVTFLGKPKKIGAQAFDMGLSTIRFYDVMKDIAAQISIGTFSHRDDRFQVFIYFLRNFENGAFDSEVAKENWEYIARHMNEFEYNLMENEDLRQIMLAHCVFKEKDIDRLIEKSVENHKIALTAELLEYKNTLKKGKQ